MDDKKDAPSALGQQKSAQADSGSKSFRSSSNDAQECAASHVQRSLAQIKARESLNAFCYINSDAAIERAQWIDAHPEIELPLRGMTVGVKDNVHVAGMPNTAGTLALKDFIPEDSALIVKRLEDAGAIIVGKTGMHELAYGITSNNFAFGPICNPCDETKIPGGSSGGSAAAVAGGLVDVAIGTDTGGSVRLPAALTGIFGFRPTSGRYSQGGMMLISPTRDTIGFMAQNVSDIIRLDAIATETDSEPDKAKLDGLRLGVPSSHFFEDLDPDVEKVCRKFLEKLSQNGVELVSVDVADIIELNSKIGFPIVLYETAQQLPEYLQRYHTGVSVTDLLEGIRSPDVAEIVKSAMSGAVSEADYLVAIREGRHALQARYDDCFKSNKIDALIFPTSPITARNIVGSLVGVDVNGEQKDTFTTYIQNVDPASNAGLPGISLPIGRSSDGLPIGIELDAPAGCDGRLLRIAAALEEFCQPIMKTGA